MKYQNAKMPWNVVEHRGTSNWMEHMELIQGSVARQLLVVPGVQCLTLKARTTRHNALQRRVNEVSVQCTAATKLQ